MKLRQGTFSFLPDLTDAQIHTQVQYCIDNGWAVSVEYTDDPHPRNTYWEMWGHPMFDNPDAAAAVFVVDNNVSLSANEKEQVLTEPLIMKESEALKVQASSGQTDVIASILEINREDR